MAPELYVREVEKALMPLADSAKAEKMRAYLLGQFEFLGLPAPVRRDAVKPLSGCQWHSSGDLLSAAHMLWNKPEREYRYTAIDLLRRHDRCLQPADLSVIRQLLLRDAWWETVDGLTAVIGAVLRAQLKSVDDPEALMDQWIVDSNFWVRRCAMLHQLGWRLDTNAKRLFAYAESLADEKEFFIRKAIGWALRDYSRWNPEAVSHFVREKRGVLSGLTAREAVRRLPAPLDG